jgi:hypothetical protein
MILFPAPAHLTLLRVTDFGFGKSVKHLSVTFLLFLILFGSAFMQIVTPGAGRLWMIIPPLSGIAILWANRSLKRNFKPFNLSSVLKERAVLIIGSIFLFTVVTVLPDLDFIELNQTANGDYDSWILELPYWQELLILVSTLSLLFVGYVIISANTVSINRLFILYACFILFTFQIYLILYGATSWLKIQGGFHVTLIIELISAILALDYWDAKTFGQYTRRYFFLTCTKGLTFIFFWLCLFGLPQKFVSLYSTYYYEKVKPAAVQISPQYLLFDERDRFESAHETARRIRASYTKAFLNSASGELSQLTQIIDQNKHTVIPGDSDVSRLSDLVGHKKIKSTAMDFKKIPLFRPMKSDWDVILTALVLQGTISEKELDRYVSGFKAILPKTSQGQLPDIYTPYEARYVSLATGTHIDFIPPVFEDIEHLSKNGYCPVLSLRLAGKDYWVALLYMDHESGIAWFRIETVSSVEESVQLLFDSYEYETYRNEILSRLIIPVSIDYLRDTLENNSAPVVIFSKNGIAEAMPDRFDGNGQQEIDRAVAAGSSSERWATTLAENPTDDECRTYAFYLRAISHVKSMTKPEGYERNLFSETASDGIRGVARLGEIDALLERISPLRDRDRMDIACLLVQNKHVYAAPDLFIKLSSEKPMLSDLIDCHDAFLIGRQLFMLGYHEEAFSYMELAFQRHPFNSEYEQWYHIAMVKLNRQPPPLYSPANHQPYLRLYFQTITDVQNGKEKRARKRLEKVLEKDSHDSLANHLLSKYFSRPLDDRHFFPAEEGL